MLSDAQVQLYGRQWGAVCRANDWRMARGRLVPEAALELSQLHKEVAALARQHALQNSRSTNVEDLRRGCTARIAKTFCSTKDLDNSQFDRLLILFRLLMNPDDLQGVMDWELYEKYDHAKKVGLEGVEDPGVRRRLVGSIRAMSKDREAYLYAIVRDKFDTCHWEELDLRQLRQLAMTMRQRVKKYKQPLEAVEVDASGNPDWRV